MHARAGPLTTLCTSLLDLLRPGPRPERQRAITLACALCTGPAGPAALAAPGAPALLSGLLRALNEAPGACEVGVALPPALAAAALRPRAAKAQAQGGGGLASPAAALLIHVAACGARPPVTPARKAAADAAGAAAAALLEAWGKGHLPDVSARLQASKPFR